MVGTQNNFNMGLFFILTGRLSFRGKLNQTIIYHITFDLVCAGILNSEMCPQPVTELLKNEKYAGDLQYREAL